MVLAPKTILPALLAAVVLLGGCVTVSQSEIDAADCYLFPDFKTTTQPQFAMTLAERTKAIRVWRAEAKTAWTSGILYEVVVDGAGDVVRIRAAQPYLKDDNEQYFTRAFQHIVQGYKFKQDATPNVYRTFYYPMLLTSQQNILNEP